MWRDMDGESVFTGIVVHKSGDGQVFKKLDDPRGELDGPGHDMEESELLSQLALYDNSIIERVQSSVDVCGYAGKQDDLHVDDLPFFDWYMERLGQTGFGPIDFFPHEVTRLRADDLIVLKANGTGVDPGGQVVPAVERFWAHVVSVTPCGKITAVPRANLMWSSVGMDKPILVPIEAVIAVQHGMYW